MNTRIRNILALIAGLLLGCSALAQTVVVPSGGVTIKSITTRADGFVGVQFVEPISEITACPSSAYGTPFMATPVWVNNSAGSKTLITTLLLAHATGRKIESFAFTAGQWCEFFHVRLAQ